MTDKNILVVEDDPMIRKSYYRLLSPYYTVVLASDGIEGLNFAKQFNFDAIISDIMMPNMDGMEFYNELEKEKPELLSKILFVSGGQSTKDTQEFAQSANVNIMNKPVNPKLLLEAVKNLTQ